MAYDPGDVVLLPFPFRDRLAEKTRPAIVVSARANNQGGDIVVAAVTTNPARSSQDYALLDWQSAKLQAPSTVRMLLATLAHARVALHIGKCSALDWAEIYARVLAVFQ